MRRLILSPCLLFLVCVGAFSMDYQALLDAVLAADPALTSLAIAERQAEVALKRATVTQGKLLWVAQTGEVKTEISSTNEPSIPNLSARPEISVELPRGPSAQLGVPISIAADGATATPRLGLSVPLLQGSDQHQVAVRQQELVHKQSLTTYQNRYILLEKLLVERLITLYRASSASIEANRKLLKAQVELNKAVHLDGAVVGGKAYLDGERAVRIAAREVQRANADYRQQLSELALLSGRPESPDLIPDTIPDIDLSVALPELESLPLIQQARDNLRLVAFEAREKAKASVAALQLGGGYGLGTAPRVSSSRTGVDLTSGLNFTSEEWTTAMELGWNQATGPRLQFSLAWKPLAPGEAALKGEAASLEVLAQEQAVKQALIEGARSLKSLELKRAQLLHADQGLEEDLRWAALQVSRYQDWLKQVLVTQTELDEVEATLQSLQTEVTLQRLDRLAWSLDRKLLLDKEQD